jgi:hypothetical protein
VRLAAQQMICSLRYRQSIFAVKAGRTILIGQFETRAFSAAAFLLR